MHYQEENLPLTPDERATLRRQSITRIAWVLAVAAIMISGVRWMFGRIRADTGSHFFMGVFGLMATLFVGTLLYLLIGFVRDMSATHKLVVRGTLTNKEVETVVHSTSRNRSSTEYYFFYFDQKKLSVEAGVYEQFHPGQVIEIDRTTASHSLIAARLLADPTAPPVAFGAPLTAGLTDLPEPLTRAERWYLGRVLIRRILIWGTVGTLLAGVVYLITIFAAIFWSAKINPTAALHWVPGTAAATVLGLVLTLGSGRPLLDVLSNRKRRVVSLITDKYVSDSPKYGRSVTQTSTWSATGYYYIGTRAPDTFVRVPAAFYAAVGYEPVVVHVAAPSGRVLRLEVAARPELVVDLTQALPTT